VVSVACLCNHAVPCLRSTILRRATVMLAQHWLQLLHYDHRVCPPNIFLTRAYGIPPPTLIHHQVRARERRPRGPEFLPRYSRELQAQSFVLRLRFHAV
jgi:hypothetical protein